MAKLIKSTILDREIDVEKPEVVVELCEGLARVVAEGRAQILKDLKAVQDGNKSNSDLIEASQRAIKNIETEMAGANRKVLNMPQFDPGDLAWDDSPEAFHRALVSKPAGNETMNRVMGDLQHSADDFFIVRKLLETRQKRGLSEKEMYGLKSYKRFKGIRDKFFRALDSQTTGEGIEWIPTDFSSQIREKVALQLKVAALFDVYNMPTNPWKFPFEAAFPDVQRVPETTTLPANPYSTSGVAEAYNPGDPTRNQIWTLKKNRALEVVSFEFEEDSIIAAMPFIRRRIPYGIARGREKGILNGDTSSTHLDNDVVGQGSIGTAPETTIDGLRDFYLSQGSPAVHNVTAQPTSADYRTVKAMMGEHGADPMLLAWLVSVWGAAAMMQNPDVRTVDKLGEKATIKYGQIADFDGSPVILSGMMKDNLHTNGKNTSGQANDRTAILCANTLNWGIGEKGQRELEEERWLITDQRLLVMFDRYEFKYIGATTDKAVGAIHGIPLTLVN